MVQADERPPRPGGPRRSAVPWLPLAVGATVAVPVAPVLLVWGGVGWNNALRSVLLFLIAATFSWSMARRQRQPQAERLDDLGSGEGAVLFLRSFRSEQVPFSQADAHGRRGPVHRKLAFLWTDPNEEFVSFERYLGPLLSERIGPVIALGAPSDRLPPESPVVRYYASDETWHEAVEKLLPAVRCVVMPIGSFSKLRWELACVRQARAAAKLFLVTSPYAPGAARRPPVRLVVGQRLLRYKAPHWASVVGEFAEEEFVLPAEDPGPGSVLAFTAQRRGELLVSGASRAEEYIDAIAAALPPVTDRGAAPPA